MKKYFMFLCALFAGASTQVHAAAEVVTITEVVDIPGLLTTYVGELGAIIAIVVGASLSIGLVWKGVSMMRRGLR